MDCSPWFGLGPVASWRLPSACIFCSTVKWRSQIPCYKKNVAAAVRQPDKTRPRPYACPINSKPGSMTGPHVKKTSRDGPWRSDILSSAAWTANRPASLLPRQPARQSLRPLRSCVGWVDEAKPIMCLSAWQRPWWVSLRSSWFSFARALSMRPQL
jgi:hypothetical protein